MKWLSKRCHSSLWAAGKCFTSTLKSSFYFHWDFYLNLLFLRCVYQPSFSSWNIRRLREAWPAHFFIFHLSCTVSPGNNSALHYITSPFCIHTIQSDIQRRSDTPPILTIIGRTIPSKSQVGQKKKREGLYLRWRLTSICDTINQFGPSFSLFLGVSSLSSLFK